MPSSARIPLATGLAQLGDPEAHDFLRTLAQTPGGDQLVAARALAAPAESELAPLFRRTLDNNRDEPTRMLAVTGLGLTGERRDVTRLATQLEKESAAGSRLTTAAAILTLGSREPASLNDSSARFINQALDGPRRRRGRACPQLG